MGGPDFGRATLTDCDREPIHVPGSIQPHGCLLVVRPGDGEIIQAAGDFARVFGGLRGAARQNTCRCHRRRCRGGVACLRAATGFDRVMVYRFLKDGSGVVVAEAKDDCLESYLDLHYPESDIPKQARELYRKTSIRAIPDVDYIPAPLRTALNPTTNAPLDLSYSQRVANPYTIASSMTNATVSAARPSRVRVVSSAAPEMSSRVRLRDPAPSR